MYDPFDLSDAVIRDFPHVKVTRQAPQGRRRCEYRKVFKPEGLADAAYWIGREYDFLLYFAFKGMRHVVEHSELRQGGDGTQIRQVEAVATFDAGVTVSDWLKLRPRYPGGAEHAHPFAHAGQFLALLRACLLALHDIHSHGIVHCDIKADNLCLPYEPYPKTGPVSIRYDGVRLIDFAFSITPERPLAKPLPIAPGADYHSPRFQAALREDWRSGAGRHAQALDWREDLFSLGVMAGEIVNQAPLLLPQGKPGLPALAHALELVDWLQGFGAADLPADGRLPHRQAIAEIDAKLAALQDWENYRRFTVSGLVASGRGAPTALAARCAERQPKPPRTGARRWLWALLVLAAGVFVASAYWRFQSSKPPAPPPPKPAADFGIDMVSLPGGTFQMGCGPKDGKCETDEKPRHAVTVRPFALAKTEATQGQWKAVMGVPPPDLRFKDCGDDCPVERVSWDDAQAFIRRLNEMTGKRYRLPTEAEWEYACRAGQDSLYAGGDDLDKLAWHHGNAGGKTHPVKGQQPNAFGLYDMSGNVGEWVQDQWHDNYQAAPADGSAWENGGGPRVLRGGSWFNKAGAVRCAVRYSLHPDSRDSSIGLRLVLGVLPGDF